MSDDVNKGNVVAAIKQYIAQKGLSREQFAFKAKVSKSSVDKLLTGNFTEKAISKIEHNIGEKFSLYNVIKKSSSNRHGEYSYEESKIYIGIYEFLRYDVQKTDVIHCYVVDIEWDDELSCLAMTHRGIKESGFKQKSEISLTKSSGYMMITSGGDGWHQLCILNQFSFTKIMSGGILTVGNIMGQMFAPVAAPVCLRKVDTASETRKIRDNDTEYLFYNQLLKNVTSQGFLKIIS